MAVLVLPLESVRVIRTLLMPLPEALNTRPPTETVAAVVPVTVKLPLLVTACGSPVLKINGLVCRAVPTNVNALCCPDVPMTVKFSFSNVPAPVMPLGFT